MTRSFRAKLRRVDNSIGILIPFAVLEGKRAGEEVQVEIKPVEDKQGSLFEDKDERTYK